MRNNKISLKFKCYSFCWTRSYLINCMYKIYENYYDKFHVSKLISYIILKNTSFIIFLFLKKKKRVLIVGDT